MFQLFYLVCHYICVEIMCRFDMCCESINRPGIMDAVPVGWKRGSMETDQQTQGVSCFFFVHVFFAVAPFFLFRFTFIIYHVLISFS